jgi:hypothetical protein
MEVTMDPLQTIAALLEMTPLRWNELARLPEALVHRPPAAGEWSAAECLWHMLDTERQVFPARVRWLLAGQDFPSFDPDREGSHSQPPGGMADWARELTVLRAESVSLVRRLRQEDLACTARHQELGVVTMAELLHEWAGHDLLHLMQAERALLQPFIDGCGPWLPYFAGHRFPSAQGS